ncbi:hypothetical protein B0H99_103276 [Planomicrobium soli]|uniref:Uncharacterized protein n=1 Tax=Planomicrobium soli TaxID=1176648 RepID=A0A2P8H4J9_9BACL|nr:hypothetical protein B0H99_103276 [Planomicrobium soli]
MDRQNQIQIMSTESLSFTEGLFFCRYFKIIKRAPYETTNQLKNRTKKDPNIVRVCIF